MEKYSKPQVNAIHDTIVSQIDKKLSKNHITSSPDKLYPDKKMPDLQVDGDTNIEVKVINPSNEDYKIDEKAIKEFEERSWAETGGTIHPDSIMRAVRGSLNQLLGLDAKVRILVIVSTLEFQNSQPDLIKYILNGLIQIQIPNNENNRRPSKTRRVKVPVTQKFSSKVDAILYVYGKKMDKNCLWHLNGKTYPIYNELSEHVSYMWQ